MAPPEVFLHKLQKYFATFLICILFSWTAVTDEPFTVQGSAVSIIETQIQAVLKQLCYFVAEEI